MNLATMRVLLTGATGGIGGAIAEALLSRGSAVLATGRDPRALDDRSRRLARFGDKVTFVRADLLVPDDRERLSQYVDLAPGRYWIDSAGNAGMEGLPAMINLVEQAQANGQEDPFAAAAQGYPGAEGELPYLFEPQAPPAEPPAPAPAEPAPAADGT